MPQCLAMVVAMDKNRGIGINNTLPWNIPEDMEWFKRVTMNKVVVMGRKTYESIGHPLPKRTNIVLTTDKTFRPHKDVIVVHSIEEVLKVTNGFIEVLIMGGANIYKQFLPYTDRLYITRIDKEYVVDTHFPEIDYKDWKLSVIKEGKGVLNTEYAFYVYDKVRK